MELNAATAALFLDVDAALFALTDAPEAIGAEPAVLELLRTLSLRGGGAVALLSGRSLADVDALFGSLLLPAAGLHGFERRSASGVYRRRQSPAASLIERARRLMFQISERYPGVLLEDKHFALALKYSYAPELEDDLVRDVSAVARLLGSAFDIVPGRQVIEICPSGVSKATAIAEFMEESPFQGRIPVCVGDECTDDLAYQWVTAAGGLCVGVNVIAMSAAAVQLPTTGAVREWLHGLCRCTA
jgi:trehalose 6-phosphate phosphatase